MKKLLFGLIVLIFPLSVFASNTGGYYALGGGMLSFDDSVDTIEPKQIVARVGYDFNEFIGLGFEGSFSLITDELQGVDFDVFTSFIYLKLGVPLGDSARIYAMFGSTNVELTGTYNDYSVSTDDDDTGTGFGMEFNLDQGAFFIDYIKYYEGNGVDVGSVNIGYTAHF